MKLNTLEIQLSDQ